MLGYGSDSFEVESNSIWLSHHTYTERLFEIAPKDVVVFFREPVSRVVSQWAYERREKRKTVRWSNVGKYRHNPVEEPSLLEHAVANPNVQSRFVKGLDLTETFVGLFEEYSESLTRLNARFDLQLEERRVNVNPNPVAVDTETREEILRLNAEDLELYVRMRERFLKEKPPAP